MSKNKIIIQSLCYILRLGVSSNSVGGSITSRTHVLPFRIEKKRKVQLEFSIVKVSHFDCFGWAMFVELALEQEVESGDHFCNINSAKDKIPYCIHWPKE